MQAILGACLLAAAAVQAFDPSEATTTPAAVVIPVTTPAAVVPSVFVVTTVAPVVHTTQSHPAKGSVALPEFDWTALPPNEAAMPCGRDFERARKETWLCANEAKATLEDGLITKTQEMEATCKCGDTFDLIMANCTSSTGVQALPESAVGPAAKIKATTFAYCAGGTSLKGAKMLAKIGGIISGIILGGCFA